MITNGCIIDEEEQEELLWWEVKKWVFKVFKDIKYNQKKIDAYSCFLVAPFSAISNFTGKEVSYELMNKAFENLKKDWKFTKWVGWKMTDWMEYALKEYNKECKDTIKYKVVNLNPTTIIDWLESWSPIVTFIKYSKTYFQDEQDQDSEITKFESIGTGGHCITIVKINTIDKIMVKYLENYYQVLKNDIILTDFEKFRQLFWKTGIALYR